MNIEIHQPKLEALIQQRMASGRFQTVEDALVEALESAQSARAPDRVSSQRTGADLVAAMQSMPYKDDVEFDQNHRFLRG
jgi:hypothetical protein